MATLVALVALGVYFGARWLGSADPPKDQSEVARRLQDEMRTKQAAEGRARETERSAQLERERQVQETAKLRAENERIAKEKQEAEVQRQLEEQRKQDLQTRIDEQNRREEESRKEAQKREEQILADKRAAEERERQLQAALDAERAKGATMPAPPPPLPTKPAYTGPSVGQISWQGQVTTAVDVIITTELASRGIVSGGLPGVPCDVRIVSSFKPAIVESPSPSNDWSRIVLRLPKKGDFQFAVEWRVLDSVFSNRKGAAQ